MSDKAEFKVGDVVRLKSGGPRMTVMSVPQAITPYVEKMAREYGVQARNPDLVGCVWFAGDHAHDAYFPADALEPWRGERGQQAV